MIEHFYSDEIFENDSKFSFKGREEVRNSLQRFISYLCHEMDSNKRIPYDSITYDFLVRLSYDIDHELGF